jgi:hypothetical protein
MLGILSGVGVGAAEGPRASPLQHELRWELWSARLASSVADRARYGSNRDGNSPPTCRTSDRVHSLARLAVEPQGYTTIALKVFFQHDAPYRRSQESTNDLGAA